MPDRVIRDELLTSERYWSVSLQAQQLYIHLVLCVDDAARFSGKNFTLRSACFPGRPMEALAMEKMLTELADVDLVRLYTVGFERYVFIPRFRNRRRYVGSSKYPVPPIEINDLAEEKSSLSQPQVIPESSSSQEERGRRGVGVGVGVGVGEEPIVPSALVNCVAVDPPATVGYSVSTCPYDDIVSIFHEVLPTLPRVKIMTSTRQKKIRSRWVDICGSDKLDQQAGLEWFRWYFSRVSQSDFLLGRIATKDGRAWKADLEWLMHPANLVKVLEHGYPNRRKQP
jgi:hypothetical protein